EATTVPPALFRAARHGHRLAFRSAAAALTDAAAQLGHHVATTEGALQTVDAELGFVTA
ncbi:MAG: hypothetical protein JWN41_506, partial [Thermoleophilia bacterium]|nr:hypothetical protein [Thermoleophilia bacterium]